MERSSPLEEWRQVSDLWCNQRIGGLGVVMLSFYWKLRLGQHIQRAGLIHLCSEQMGKNHGGDRVILDRQWSWQVASHWTICPSLQEMCGLCVCSHGNHRMIAWLGEWMTQNLMYSEWRVPICSLTSSVICKTFPSPMGRSSSTSTAKGKLQGVSVSLLQGKFMWNKVSSCPRI